MDKTIEYTRSGTRLRVETDEKARMIRISIGNACISFTLAEYASILEEMNKLLEVI